MLRVDNLSVSVGDKQILSDITFSLQPGQVLALMGPNGSGKSSLMHAIMGNPQYTITHGGIFVGDNLITGEPVEKRARAGLFLAFQHPYHIPGVRVITFLHAAHAALSGTRMPLVDFRTKLTRALSLVGLPEAFADRPLNDGFSGGERKRLELAQLLVLPVRVALLDELDSGLDADGVRTIIDTLTLVRTERPELSLVLVSHYARLLEELAPDQVIVLSQGKLIEYTSGQRAHVLAEQGYQSHAQQ